MCKHAPGLTRLHPLLFRIEPIREVGEIFQGYYFGVHLAPFYRLGSFVDFIGIHLPEVQWSFAVTETPKARDSIALSGFKATGAKKRDSVEN